MTAILEERRIIGGIAVPLLAAVGLLAAIFSQPAGAQQASGCAANNTPGLVATCELMLTFRDQLAGTATLNWSADTPMTDWEGVTLAGEPQAVTVIDLQGKGLNGRIPGALGGISSLTHLYLNTNGLTGWIPGSLGNLPNLVHLYLFGNQLTGSIPAELGNLSNLTALDLASNQLTGRVPAELGNLSNLTFLDFTTNQLTGPLPDSLTALTALDWLLFGNNAGLCAPDDEVFQAWLESLSTYNGPNCSELARERAALVEFYHAMNGPAWTDKDNWLSTRPIAEWYGVSVGSDGRVFRMNLYANGMSGVPPASLGHLTGLTDLSLGSNDIPDISGLAGLANLRSLWLSEILSSQTPDAPQRTPLDLSPLAGLTNLERLDLSANKISDLRPLGGLTNLVYLDLSSINVKWDESDTSTLDLSPLAGLTSLDVLFLSHNSLSDIALLAELATLSSLGVSGNQIVDISPLAAMTNMEYFTADQNDIEDLGALSGLTSLRYVQLNVNEITDISPLVANTGLGDGNVVEVRSNPLNAESIFTHIPALRARGVQVAFDDVVLFEEPQIHNGNLLVMPVTENLAAGSLPLKAYAERFYDHFRDEFDFLMFVPNLLPGQHEPGVSAAATYTMVRNDVQGIGRPIATHNEEWGSAGRLQGVIDFGSYTIYPDRGLSIVAEGPTLHELIHRWANAILPNRTGGHWGFSSANGVLGGFDISDLVDHGEGRYSAGDFTTSGLADNVVPFGPIELYLAGFIPPEDVPDLWVAEDGDWLRDEEGQVIRADDGDSMFAASEVKTYTIEDIIAKHGPRAPDASQAQKEFRAATILLVDQNHPATRESLERLSADVSWFSHPGEDQLQRYNFFEATGGRGTIVMDLSQFTKDTSVCVSGGAVADATNAGLIADCEALLKAQDSLAVSATLDWSADTTISDWEGITVRGTPARVAWLNIRAGDLGGSLPAELGQLSGLTYLNLRNNGLTGPIPTELGNLTNLRYLGLNNNELTGSIPDLSGMTGLEQLYLSNNDLSGGLPEWMGTLTKLRELWLWGNRLEGPIPDLSGMTGLDRLKLQDNELTGGIPAWFGEMTNLRYLYLHRNPLGGTIPNELGGMIKLRYVWLHTSELTGSIPSELGNLSNLWDLNLHSNELSGPIPPELGDLSGLTHMRLHRNELSGAIPGELGNLSRLKFMWLHGNRLSGQIPSELGELVNLQRLYLSENELSGEIPVELDSLADTLTHWRLAGNQFTGCVPTGLAGVEDTDLVSLGLEVCAEPPLTEAECGTGDAAPVHAAAGLIVPWLREYFPDHYARLSQQPWFADGLDDEDAALVFMLLEALSYEMFDDLIEARPVRSRTLCLQSGDVFVFVIQHPIGYTSSDDLLDAYETGVPILEDFMGEAFPKRHHVVLLAHPDNLSDRTHPDAPWPDGMGGLDGYYNQLFTRIGYDPERVAPIENSIYHEAAHSYWYLRTIPFWLIEGAAEFLEFYVHERTGQLVYSDRWNAVLRKRDWRCSDFGVSNIHEWNQAAEDLGEEATWDSGLIWCAYPLGEALLLSMYDILGEEAMKAAMGQLYQYHERDGLTESQIHQVFLAHTPPGREADFHEAYQRLHGDPSFRHRAH